MSIMRSDLLKLKLFKGKFAIMNGSGKLIFGKNV